MRATSVLGRLIAIVLALALAACGGRVTPASEPSGSGATAAASSSSTPAATGQPTPAASASSPAYQLGAFPALVEAPIPATTAAHLQEILDKAVESGQGPGLTAAIISADRGTWVGAAGLADSETAMDPRAQFAIASLTKTVVAAQVLKLVEAGLADLEAPIADQLPSDLTLPTNSATLRQVLGMRSGIPELLKRDVCEDPAADLTLREAAAQMLMDPIFAAGTQFNYSNSNYLLAGLLIELVTGRPMAQALRAGVLADITLERLIYQDDELPSDPVAMPFVWYELQITTEQANRGGGFLPARCIVTWYGSSGAMASDAMTLARWGYRLYGGSALEPSSLEAMTDTEDDGYGLGLEDFTSRFGTRAVGHQGWLPGYRSILVALPAEATVIVVLRNTDEPPDLQGIALVLHQVLDSED